MADELNQHSRTALEAYERENLNNYEQIKVK